jgi:hypothetical protein
MDIVLATILGVMGTVDVGNPLSLDPGFSIGGKSHKVSNLLDNISGLVGTVLGLIKGYKSFLMSLQVHREVFTVRTISLKPIPRIPGTIYTKLEMLGP